MEKENLIIWTEKKKTQVEGKNGIVFKDLVYGYMFSGSFILSKYPKWVLFSCNWIVLLFTYKNMPILKQNITQQPTSKWNTGATITKERWKS